MRGVGMDPNSSVGVRDEQAPGFRFKHVYHQRAALMGNDRVFGRTRGRKDSMHVQTSRVSGRCIP